MGKSTFFRLFFKGFNGIFITKHLQCNRTKKLQYNGFHAGSPFYISNRTKPALFFYLPDQNRPLLALVEFTKKGIFVPKADCYIDPLRKVKRAIVTHGHSDHCRKGSETYYCTPMTASIIDRRYGIKNSNTFHFGDQFVLDDVIFSFHPAGHIPGSAQVRIEYQGEVWVISGDYKRQQDRICLPFEVVPCDHFVTECTFGMPIFHWKDETTLATEVRQWWAQNQDQGLASVITGYSLGKAQRLLQLIEHPPGPIYVHPVIETMNEAIRDGGFTFMPYDVFEGFESPGDIDQALIIATPGALQSDWFCQIGPAAIATASGWNQTRKRRRGNALTNFVISDHADWRELIQTVEETTAENIYVMHGFTTIFGQHLADIGYRTQRVEFTDK